MKWKVARLDEVCLVGPRDPALPETAPFVPMAHVEVGARYPTGYEHRGTRGGIRARANDILFARITPCLENGKVAQLPADACPTGGSTEFLVIRPGPEIDAGFLYYWSLSPEVRRKAEANMTGTTGRMRLSAKNLADFPIAYPPIDEQRRIVDLLDDHFSRVDAADSYLSSVESRESVLYGRLLHVALTEVDTVTVPFSSTLRSGLANGRSVPTQAGGFPVLRLTALRGGRIDLSARKEGAWTQSDASRFLVERGNFLISRGNGSLRLVGVGGLVTDEPDAVAYPDTLIRACPDIGQLNPEYLALVWNSAIVRRQIEASAKTTAGIYKVNQKDLGAVNIPITPLPQQAAVVARVRESRDALAVVAQERNRALARSLALRRALLSAAFSGRLTTTAPALSEPSETIGA